MNIFLDAGFYKGATLKWYLDQGIVDDTWTVYAFEANRELDISPLPWINLIKKAVWIKDGRVKFHISGREDAAGIKDLTGHTEPKEITVPSIDFSKFVSELPEAYIICSMDIEGSEYPVLEKMFKDGSIDRINELDIEFHHRFAADKTEEDSQQLIDKLEAKGIEVKLKVPLR